MLLVLLRSVFCCVFLLAQIAGTSSPQIFEPSSSELLVNEGESVILKCQGASKLSWKYPEFVKVQKPPIAERIQQTDLVEGNRHESTFTLSPSQYADTGEFSCIYENDASTAGFQSSIYVYVHSTEHLFAPHKTSPDPAIITTVEGRSFEIPCRVTNPSISVKLLKNNNPVEPNQYLIFNSRIGFTASFATIFYFGNFACAGSFNGVSERMTFILFYQANKALPPPIIAANHSNAETNRNSESFVKLGDTLSLICSLQVDSGQRMDLRWSATLSDRVTQGDLIKRDAIISRSLYDVFERTLTITDVQKIDEGNYSCNAYSAINTTSNTTHKVNVIESDYILLTASEKVVEVDLAQKNISISVTVNSTVVPVLIWYHNNEAVSFNDDRFKQESRLGRAQLKIYDINPNDAGDYMLEASTKHVTATESIELIINEPPKAKIDHEGNSTRKFFLADHSYSLRCSSTGFPPPQLNWFWQPCHVFNCQPSADLWQSVYSSRPSAKHKRSSTSVLPVSTNESGWFRCLASNKVDESEDVFQAVITDVENGFGAPQSLSFVEGDNGTIECKANKIVYYPPELDIDEYYSEASWFQIVHTNNSFSHIAVLEFRNIQTSDSVVLQCKTHDDQNKPFTWNISITVLYASMPVFVEPLDGASKALSVGKTHEMLCIAIGQPKPQYTWYHNGSIVSELNVSNGYNYSDTKLVIPSVTFSHSGVYTCQASNREGVIVSNHTLIVTDGNSEMKGKLAGGYIALIVISCLALVTIAVVMIYMSIRWRMDKYMAVPYDAALHPDAAARYNPDLPVHEQVDCLAYDPAWEFPKQCLKFDIVLGQGAFGKVMRAEAFGIHESEQSTRVAVKMVKHIGDREQLQSLMSELKILIHVGSHLNIVNLLGAVTVELNRGALYVIVEYCCHGCLREYLLKHRDAFLAARETSDDEVFTKANSDPDYANSPTLKCRSSTAIQSSSPLDMMQLICFAYQIAKGMEYLSSKKFIHRDLATRNILIADNYIVKICDFGLARDCQKYNEYQKKSDTPIPVKWMAIESLTYKIYTTKSDVWSYGILLWELFSLGANPYPGLDMDETFIERLKKGYRLPRPECCSEKIFDTMLVCWDMDPDSRPDFSQLVNSFGDLMESRTYENYLRLQETASDRTNYLPMRGTSLYLPMKENYRRPGSFFKRTSLKSRGIELTSVKGHDTEGDTSAGISSKRDSSLEPKKATLDDKVPCDYYQDRLHANNGRQDNEDEKHTRDNVEYENKALMNRVL